MRIAVLLLGLFAAACAQAEVDSDIANAAFVTGLRAYESQDFARAAEAFEQVLKVEPGCARCAHLLGKSYGRLAEQASWFSAMNLAEKTRVALEQAVRIDPNNVSAVEDLIRYYRAAPGFLGGSDEKARLLERRLQQASAERTG